MKTRFTNKLVVRVGISGPDLGVLRHFGRIAPCKFKAHILKSVLLVQLNSVGVMSWPYICI